jgi:four helix bundle protein
LALGNVNIICYFCQKEFVLSKQILRSGTSIGALIMEAEHAQSTADFINKMNIALKEANEVCYWLMLLKESDYIDENSFISIYQNSHELVRLLASIVKTTKKIIYSFQLNKPATSTN